MTDPLETAAALLAKPGLTLRDCAALTKCTGLLVEELAAARPVVVAASAWVADPMRLPATDMLPTEAALLDAVQEAQANG